MSKFRVDSLPVGLAAFAAISVPSAALAQQRNFNLPAQSANTSIPEFARQAGIQIIAPGGPLRAIRTRALIGPQDVRPALRLLLQGTGLRIVADDGRTITISGQPAGAPRRVAQVTISPAASVTPAPSARVLAQSTPEKPIAEEAANEGEVASDIIVTGTRTTGLKASDSPAPIQIVGSDLLRRTGQPDLIQGLAQNLPSIQAQNAGGDQAALHLSVKLRGLSPNHTLVLINGKRRHGQANVVVSGGSFGGNAAADIGLLPMDAIERVEVLQDGAAAQYGTDAIAGVVNFILKDRPSGGLLTATAGEYIDGGGRTYQAAGNIGLSPFEGASLNVTVEHKSKDYSFRGDIDPRVVVTSSPNSTGAALLARYPELSSAPYYPYVSRNAGDALVKQTALTYNADYEVSPRLKLYSFGTFTKKLGRSNQTFRLPNVVLGKMPGDVPFPQGFTPQQVLRQTDFAVSLGVNGTVSDARFDLTSTYGRDLNKIYVENSANASLYNANSSATTKGSSPRNFHNGDLIATQWTNTLDVGREVDIGLAGPLTIAGGLEYRRETYQIRSGNPESYFGTGAQSFFGYAPVNASKNDRTNFSQYIDLSVKPIPEALLDAAVRHEHYSDFGDTTVYKLTGRYDYSSAFALRGTFSTGFRAPTLAEAYYSGINVSQTAIGGVFAPNSEGATAIGLPNLEPEKSRNISVGMVIHPTPAFTITFDTFSIKIRDRIVQSGVFFGYHSSPAVLRSPAVLDALRANGVTIDPMLFTVPGGAIGVQSFVNGVRSTTRGADLVATYSSDIGNLGRIDWSFAGNATFTRIDRLYPPPSRVNQRVQLLDLAAQAALTRTTPRYRATAGAFWRKDAFSINLRESFYSKSYSLLANAVTGVFERVNIRPKFITDLDVAYRLTNAITFSVGANNLFNVYPDKLPKNLRDAMIRQNSPVYALPYSRETPVNWNGGYYYGRASFRF